MARSVAGFKKMKVADFGLWLQEEGFDVRLAGIMSNHDIDGETFLMLEDKDFSDMGLSIGIKRRLLTKRSCILNPKKGGLDSSRFNPSVIASTPTLETILPLSLSFDCASRAERPKITIQSEIQSPFQATPHKEPEPLLPMPFELPRNYPPIVMAELQKGMLSGSGKAKFIASIAAAIFRFKAYPTSQEYDNIGQQIITMYPFLRSSSGVGYGYLLDALKQKMTYLRNFGKSKRPRAVADEHAQSASKRIKKEFKQFPQLKHEHPIPCSEDEPSHSRHQKMLQYEEKKTNPSKQTISVLMLRTFPFRRNEIMKTPRPVRDILKLYPSLRMLDELIAEMDRIMEDSPSKRASQKWSAVIPKIWKIADAENNPNIVAVLDELEDSIEEGPKSVAALTMLYYSLPDTRSKSDHNKVIAFVQEDADVNSEAKKLVGPQPIAIVRGTVGNPKDAYIAVDSEVLCQVPLDIIPFILLCAFYVFNIHYTPGCTNLFSFLEFYFLEVTPPKRGKLQHFITCIANINK